VLGEAPEPQFEGQTKTKLGNASMRSMVETTVNSNLTTWLEEHPGDAKRIVHEGSSQSQKARWPPARRAT
jgi:DNA gyrase subunit B